MVNGIVVVRHPLAGNGVEHERRNMTKKHFIALADHIRLSPVPFTERQIEILADFCQSQNGGFLRGRWLDYIAGECGPNGGKVKVTP
jgi:hypothetical protein